MAMLLILLFYGSSYALDKSNDNNLQALINSTIDKFSQFSYEEAGENMTCNLFLPDDYPGTRKYPLVIFIADENTIGKNTDEPLRQGYGGIIWASDSNQKKHKCIVLVPQYPDNMNKYINMTENLIRAVIESFQVDAQRIYITGQSEGSTTALILAQKHPDLFSAELFVSGTETLKEINGLRELKFFSIVSEGDKKSKDAQDILINRLKAAGVPVSLTLEWDARMTQDRFLKALNVIISGGSKANFIRFLNGSVMPEGITSSEYEHEYTFDVVYKIDALREWLFLQRKK